jgi:hypothetical protein
VLGTFPIVRREEEARWGYFRSHRLILDYWPRSPPVLPTRPSPAERRPGPRSAGYVPQRVPWLAPYLSELTAFPNGKHDDQVASGCRARGRLA